MRLTITVQTSANFPPGLEATDFQPLSPTWTGPQVSLPLGGGDHRLPIVGWAGNPGQAAPLHVVRAWHWREPGIAGSLTEIILVYGGDAGVRILDDTTAPSPGIDEDLPRGQGLPLLVLDAEQTLPQLPPEVQAVLRRHICAWCGADATAATAPLCGRCAVKYRQQPFTPQQPSTRPIYSTLAENPSLWLLFLDEPLGFCNGCGSALPPDYEPMPVSWGWPALCADCLRTWSRLARRSLSPTDSPAWAGLLDTDPRQAYIAAQADDRWGVSMRRLWNFICAEGDPRNCENCQQPLDPTAQPLKTTDRAAVWLCAACQQEATNLDVLVRLITPNTPPPGGIRVPSPAGCTTAVPFMGALYFRDAQGPAFEDEAVDQEVRTALRQVLGRRAGATKDSGPLASTEDLVVLLARIRQGDPAARAELLRMAQETTATATTPDAHD